MKEEVKEWVHDYMNCVRVAGGHRLAAVHETQQLLMAVFTINIYLLPPKFQISVFDLVKFFI